MTDEPTSAKVLRPRIRNAVRDALVERGWTPRRGQATDLDAPGSAVAAPLRFEWRMEADGAKYGGVRLSGSGAIRHDEAAAAVAAFPDDALPVVRGTGAERAGYFSLASASTKLLAQTIGWTAPPGELGSWTIETEAGVAPAVDAYLALVDGPLPAWLEPRRTVQALLEGPMAGDVARGAFGTRIIAMLALGVDRADLARSAVAAFTAQSDDAASRMRRFEQELADRYPGYGAPQLG